MAVSAECVVARLVADLIRVVGEDLVCLAAFGSWVSGDFCPGRSDVDVLAAMRRPPSDDDLEALRPVHARLVRNYPEWAGHVEVEYVAVESMWEIADGGQPEAQMLRISPGEPLHALPVSRHQVLDWDAARRADRTLFGPPVATVLPDFPDSLVDAVLRDHLRQWPDWLADSNHAGFRSYAVLTVARSVVRLHTGRPVSKRAGARELAVTRPQWAPLLYWAEDWWYAGGSDHDEAPPEVEAFVREQAGQGGMPAGV